MFVDQQFLLKSLVVSFSHLNHIEENFVKHFTTATNILQLASLINWYACINLLEKCIDLIYELFILPANICGHIYKTTEISLSLLKSFLYSDLLQFI
jgi:hypothetical protein